MKRRFVVAASAAAVLGAALPGSARGDETAKACAASFEQAQSLQKNLKLGAARIAAVSCTATTCPPFVRDACNSLVPAIDAAQPTIVLSAQDAAGSDLVAVQVEIDGKLLVPKLGADAVPADPGEHTLRFTYADRAPIEQHLLLRVGEKNRPVKVVFPPGGAGPTLVPPPPPARDETHTAGGSIWPSVIVGGAGLVTFAISVGVGVSAQSQANDLRHSCAPACSSSQVSSVNTQLVVSDVLTGASIAMVGVAAVLFFTRGSGKSSSQVSTPGASLAIHIAPTLNGVALTF